MVFISICLDELLIHAGLKIEITNSFLTLEKAVDKIISPRDPLSSCSFIIASVDMKDFKALGGMEIWPSTINCKTRLLRRKMRSLVCSVEMQLMAAGCMPGCSTDVRDTRLIYLFSLALLCPAADVASWQGLGPRRDKCNAAFWWEPRCCF